MFGKSPLPAQVVMAVEDMEKFRKLGLGTETQSKASATRPTGIRGRIVSYLQGVHNRSRE